MKLKPLSIATTVAIVFSISFTSAAISATTPNSAPSQSSATVPPKLENGHKGQPPFGDDQNQPLHHINEDHEGGFEKVQLLFVGGAIVVAIGLAYRAGRRGRDS